MRKAFLSLMALMAITLGLQAQTDTAAVSSSYPLDSARLHLIFPSSADALAPIHAKLYDLRHTPGEAENLNILHIGGSHVQAGMITQAARMNFETWADRGLLFPFRAIKTNGAPSYRFDYTGMWKGSRCVSAKPDVALGLAGAAAITSDREATITLRLRDEGRWDFDQLTVLGEVSDSTLVPYLLTSRQDTLWADVVSNGCEGHETRWHFTLPQPDSTVTLGCQGLMRDLTSLARRKMKEKQRRALYKPLDDEHHFVLRGMVPASSRHGVTYSESGVNGAAVPSWLRTSTLFEEELSLLPPDLVVFGIGINDANVPASEFDTVAFKRDYRLLMERIRSVSPQCRFLWITNNDCTFRIGRGRRAKKIPNPNTELVRQAMIALAKEEEGTVFDVYGLMGGLKSSQKWCDEGLMQRDHIHFTREGYELIGNLLFKAIDEDYRKWNKD